MATSQVIKTTTVRLDLTDEEALWLRALLQSQILDARDPGNPARFDREERLRIAIFDAIPHSLA